MSTKGFTNDDFSIPGTNYSSGVLSSNTGTNIPLILNSVSSSTIGLAFTGTAQTTSAGGYRIGTTNFGLFAPASTALTINMNSSSVWQTSTAGVITVPKNVCIIAELSATASNVTGDGTVYTAAFDTEIVDQNANFASNTITFPVAGEYVVGLIWTLNDLGAAFTDLVIKLVATGYSSTLVDQNPGLVYDGTGSLLVGTAVTQVLAAANDTATITVQVSGSTKTIDWYVSGNTKPVLFCFKNLGGNT